ncbi:hypothetical protein G9A89_008085 [Geosiphon pyriformis]|nr:hypothetical protein G9A89_008085 [Geosiphon pyriformis]
MTSHLLKGSTFVAFMTRSNVYGEGGGPGAQEARHGNHVWESIGKVRQQYGIKIRI